MDAICHVYTKWQRAEKYYQQAIHIRQELNQPQYLVESWAGFAKVKAAQGNLDDAQQHIQKVLDYLADNPYLNGAAMPMRTFQFTKEVLVILGQTNEADRILTLATQIIQKYLDTNSDPKAQELYLNQQHHRILWAAWQSTKSKEVECF